MHMFIPYFYKIHINFILRNKFTSGKAIHSVSEGAWFEFWWGHRLLGLMILYISSIHQSKCRDGISGHNRFLPEHFQFTIHTSSYHLTLRIPANGRAIAGFPPRWPGFEPGSGHVGFVVVKVALGQFFSE
jgi:hypothetical protein